MPEDNRFNQSALELRLKQTNRYVSMGLLGVLALCVLLFMYIGTVKQNEKTAISNSQVQADETKDSDTCKVFPEQELCVLARKIAANPTEPVVPKDGEPGKDGDQGEEGPAGRGVASFDINGEGSLLVRYTDGQTENVGKVVGKDGANGVDGVAGTNGKDGRGILSANVDQGTGSLIIRYTDGSTENLGMVVGPAGQNGLNGTNGVDGQQGIPGADGAPGKDGISVIDLQVDNTGTVVVYYSNNTSAVAGKVIINTISKLTCENDTLTITMIDGTFVSTTVDCTPDNLPNPPANPAPAPATAPLVTIP